MDKGEKEKGRLTAKTLTMMITTTLTKTTKTEIMTTTTDRETRGGDGADGERGCAKLKR